MPLTNILQFNTRVIFLFFCLALDCVWLYFVFDLVVMNSVLVVLIVRQERFASKFNNIILKETYSKA